MPVSKPLSRSFYSCPTLNVARDLLGKRLVRLEDDHQLAGGRRTADRQRTAGIICETEAYIGQTDLGCHARAGRTPRTSVMFGPAGHAYVYFTYGMHWLFNVVTEVEGFPAAVLIRAIYPTEGVERIAARRAGRPPAEWTNGPGKIAQALAIDKLLNGADLCSPDAVLFVEDAPPVPDSAVTKSARVGLNSVPEPWKSIPWRFLTRACESQG